MPSREHAGFTLVEISIVLVVVALMLGGLVGALGARQESAASRETQTRLHEIREALLGFAAAEGRLPCPAAPDTSGSESPAGGGACSNSHDGFVPGIALGIGPTDAQGYVLDAWNKRIRYAVSGGSTNALTTSIANQWGGGLTTDLRVCTRAPAGPNCDAGTALTSTAAAVLISYGRNAQAAPQHANEAANADNNTVFVAADHLQADPPGHSGCDDIVLWLSPNILYSRMINAGKLP